MERYQDEYPCSIASRILHRMHVHFRKSKRMKEKLQIARAPLVNFGKKESKCNLSFVNLQKRAFLQQITLEFATHMCYNKPMFLKEAFL